MAYLGIAKAITGGEISNPADAPESVTYTLEFMEENVFRGYISTGGGYWTFMFARPGTDLGVRLMSPSILICTNVTMSSEGVFLAGGKSVWNPGD